MINISVNKIGTLVVPSNVLQILAMTEGLTQVEITRLDEIAEKVYILEYDRFFDFEAGQIVKLAWPGQDKPRLYSIASGEKDSKIQILFNVVGDGYLTPLMAGLRPGNTLLSSKALGKFTGTEGPAWWIAQGTGIAPFASMFRSGQTGSKKLIHGGRSIRTFYFQDEFMAKMGTDYVRCSSREAGEGLFPGRVTDYIRQFKELPADSLYYLCGSAEMVVETRDLLIERKVPFSRIVSEIYF